MGWGGVEVGWAGWGEHGKQGVIPRGGGAGGGGREGGWMGEGGGGGGGGGYGGSGEGERHFLWNVGSYQN